MTVGVLIVVPLSAVGAQAAAAGDTTARPPASGARGPLQMEGTVSLLLEGYQASGIVNRRAPGSAQLAANAKFDLFGLKSGLSILYSTDRSGLRQSADRVSYNGSWRFITVEAGDVSPTFSEYGLNAVTLRGAHVALHPGPVILALAGGQSQRPVAPVADFAFREGAYNRMLYAARAGVETSGGDTRFAISGVMARDDTGSLRGSSGVRGVGGGVTPKENLSLSPELRLSFADGRLRLDAEGTVSAITHDTRTTQVDMSGTQMPGFVSDFITPRMGTRVDYATRVGAEWSASTFGLRTGYERVQPGFESLGLAQQRSDQEVLQLRPRVALLQRRLTIDGSFSTARNNLLGQSARTVRRNQLGTSVQARLARTLSISGTIQQMDNTSRAEDAGAADVLGDLRQVARSITLTPTFSLVRGTLVHTATVSISSQTVDDHSDASIPAEVRAAYGSSGLNTTATYALALPTGLSFTVTGNHSHTEASSFESRMTALTLGAGHMLFQRRLSMNATAGWSAVSSQLSLGTLSPDAAERRSRQLTSSLTSAYRLPTGDQVRLTLRSMNNSAVAGTGRSYSEYFSTLQYERRF